MEAAIGTTALWDRGGDKKSSKICVELNGISVNNEVDWPRMRKFHAEMSKRICDAIAPYILNKS